MAEYIDVHIVIDNYATRKARQFASLAKRSEIIALYCDRWPTPQDSLAEIAAAAAGSGRHVLVKKPAGRRPSDVPAEGHALWLIATAEVAQAIIVDRHVPIEFFHAMALSQIRTPHK